MTSRGQADGDDDDDLNNLDIDAIVQSQRPATSQLFKSPEPSAPSFSPLASPSQVAKKPATSTANDEDDDLCNIDIDAIIVQSSQRTSASQATVAKSPESQPMMTATQKARAFKFKKIALDSACDAPSQPKKTKLFQESIQDKLSKFQCPAPREPLNESVNIQIIPAHVGREGGVREQQQHLPPTTTNQRQQRENITQEFLDAFEDD